MKIQPINNNLRNTTVSPSHKANLWVCKSVKEVIEPNKNAFIKAAEMYDGWLNNEKGHIQATMQIRKNTSFLPKVVIERYEPKVTYAYPHEESGYTYNEMKQYYEDLEFEMNGRKCGFWFDPSSSAEKLLSDFKNMFNFLSQ